jgi:hypothetical protein
VDSLLPRRVGSSTLEALAVPLSEQIFDSLVSRASPLLHKRGRVWSTSICVAESEVGKQWQGVTGDSMLIMAFSVFILAGLLGARHAATHTSRLA